MKFLHAADLHLDRSFEGLTTIPEGFRPFLATANQKMLIRLVDVALQEKVDVVLLAGDTFHQNRPSLKTQQFFFQEMARLAQAEIPVYMIFGNHDHYQAERYWFDFPKNIRLFTKEEVETQELTLKNGETVAISGFSYQHPTLLNNISSSFPRKKAVDFHIGLYHGGQAPYAPFTLTQLAEKGYDYWALGHIHTPQMLSRQPLAVYPGTPQGHTQKETETGICLVESVGRRLQVQPRSIASVRWEKRTVSLKNIRQNQAVFSSIKEQEYGKQPLLLHLELSDGEHLGEELLRQIRSGELLDVLSQFLPSHVCLWRLTSASSLMERPYLAVEPSLIEELLATYRMPEIFSELLPELVQQPSLRSFVTREFREETLEQLQKQMNQSYHFRRSTDEDQKS